MSKILEFIQRISYHANKVKGMLYKAKAIKPPILGLEDTAAYLRMCGCRVTKFTRTFPTRMDLSDGSIEFLAHGQEYHIEMGQNPRFKTLYLKDTKKTLGEHGLPFHHRLLRYDFTYMEFNDRGVTYECNDCISFSPDIKFNPLSKEWEVGDNSVSIAIYGMRSFQKYKEKEKRLRTRFHYTK